MPKKGSQCWHDCDEEKPLVGETVLLKTELVVRARYLGEEDPQWAAIEEGKVFVKSWMRVKGKGLRCRDTTKSVKGLRGVLNENE